MERSPVIGKHFKVSFMLVASSESLTCIYIYLRYFKKKSFEQNEHDDRLCETIRKYERAKFKRIISLFQVESKKHPLKLASIYDKPISEIRLIFQCKFANITK